MTATSPNTISTNPASANKRRGGIWAWVAAIGMIVIGSALVIYPFWPKLEFALSKKQAIFPYTTKLTNNGQLASTVSLSHLPVAENKPAPKENRLVIPSIGVDMAILEGANEKVLDRGGIWRIPASSNPAKGSNTVLSGHRWQYLPPSSRTLYLLDKVQIGEPIVVYWEGQEYDYRVARREVVDSTRTDIQNATTNPQLTIFTCTPLFSTKQRLVIYGDLIS